MKKLRVEDVWKEYEKGLRFNGSIRLNECVEENENFFIGRQWEGVVSNGLPTPVFNFLKQVVQHQVASITSDNLKMHASPLASAGHDPRTDSLMNVVNNEFAAIMERNHLTNMLREYARNAAVDGDGCLYTYWEDEEIRTDVLENTRVFFGNPNDRRVQSQPYIIVARREMVEELRLQAEENGAGDEVLRAIRPDGDENRSAMDALVDDKCTVLLYLWRDRKSGTIHGCECVREAFLRPEWDMHIRLYPLTWLNWDYVRDCYHGQALITGLIHNQEFVNKAYAASMLSLMMSAFPKVIYDKSRVTKWSNQVGAQIGVTGDVGSVARILEPAQISPQVAQFIESAIENTRNFTGATATALGQTRPDNTSAILALQRAAAIPAEITRQELYRSVEELGHIYVEFMTFYYGERTVEAPAAELLPKGAAAFAELDEDARMTVPFDFSLLKDVNLFLKLDVGASAYWSEIASMQTLDNLLNMGLITLTDYLERLPDGYISKRQELLSKYRRKEEEREEIPTEEPSAENSPAEEPAL